MALHPVRRELSHFQLDQAGADRRLKEANARSLGNRRPLPTEEVAEQVASRRGVLFGALLLGAGVAVSLGVYGRVHDPPASTACRLRLLRHGRLQVLDRDRRASRSPSCRCSGAVALRPAPGSPAAPRWLGTAHRASGALAVVLSAAGRVLLPLRPRVLPDPFRRARWCTPWPGAPSTAPSPPRWCSCTRAGCPAGRCRAGGLLFTAIVVLWWTGAIWYWGVEGVSLTGRTRGRAGNPPLPHACRAA